MTLLSYEERVLEPLIADWEPIPKTNRAYIFEYHAKGTRVTEVNIETGEELACGINNHWVRIDFPWPDYWWGHERAFALFFLRKNKEKFIKTA